MNTKPFILPEQNIAELTVRSVLLAIILTILLALSNAYLALKLGILTSASIPAAIISMSVLRLFKNATILENNAVQTAASAGEAVAGGIVYTIPALVIIHYWQNFDYLTNFFIAFVGGVLGVLFSIPLRHVLVNERTLKFPEGQAIAEVLKCSAENTGVRDIVLGGLAGGTLELLQTGFKIIATEASFWTVSRGYLFSFGTGFSATMIGAGYLIGYELSISIFLGAVIAWMIVLPVLSHSYPYYLLNFAPKEAGFYLWNDKIRYLGIGAMLFAGVWTFLKLVKPLGRNISQSFLDFSLNQSDKKLLRTDKDIPIPFLLIGIILMAALLFLFFQFTFPLETVGIDENYEPSLIFGAVFYVLVVGFLFSVITAYFSGMVGVTASPGSSIVIAGMLFAAWILLTLINHWLPLPLSYNQIRAAEAITIIIGSVVTGIAAIANDNTQDLKVGQLVGATPWKQQCMLLLGVLVSSLVIPLVMQLLFNGYGIADVVPEPSMDLSQTLPAPTATLMAAITQAVFTDTLPWTMMLVGALIIAVLILINYLCSLKKVLHLSFLGIAIGMYLPLGSSVPLFIGGMIALIADKRLQKKLFTQKKDGWQIGVLIACGLVAGSALIQVILAIPFSVMHSPNAFKIVSDYWSNYGVILGFITVFALGIWIVKRVDG